MNNPDRVAIMPIINMVIEQRNKNDAPISSKGTSESQQEE